MTIRPCAGLSVHQSNSGAEWIVVGEAENGKIAVVMVGTHQPHLVILDLSMPVMNGIDAAQGDIENLS